MKTDNKNKKENCRERVMETTVSFPNYVRISGNLLSFFMPINPKSVLIGKAEGLENENKR